VLYNRIPKSGSASIMSWMSGQLNATAQHRHGLEVTNAPRRAGVPGARREPLPGARRGRRRR